MVTPLQGLKKIAPQSEIVYCDGSDVEAAKEAARGADAVIFVAGMDYKDEGEFIEHAGSGAGDFDSRGGDRRSLALHRNEIELIRAVAPENKNSVVVLMGGNTIMVSEWLDAVSAVLMAYYPGQEGGTAIAEILFGDVNPSGKLPFVIPERESDLPQVNWDTTEQWYDYYHGYAKLEKEGIEPLFPYGFGLSYTRFELSDAEFQVKKDETGERRGAGKLHY